MPKIDLAKRAAAQAQEETKPALISRPAAAHKLGGVSERTVDRLCSVGKLRWTKVGSRKMIFDESVDALIGATAAS